MCLCCKLDASGPRVHLRVLQIDGDLIKLNLFEQENIIGDADQMRLDMQRMQEGFAAQAQIVTGSNALINIATVTESGVDSIIMAGGTVYDDALIHQADWFDTDAPADGVLMAGLTNDAVAAFPCESADRLRIELYPQIIASVSRVQPHEHALFVGGEGVVAHDRAEEIIPDAYAPAP